MINYIKSELYKSMYNNTIKTTMKILFLLIIVSIIIIKYFSDIGNDVSLINTELSFNLFLTSMNALIFIVLCIQNKIEFGEDKSNTIKHSVNFGIPRSTIYIGRQIVGIFVTTIIYLTVCFVYIGASYLLLYHSNNHELILMLKGIISALPIYIAVYTVGQALRLNMSNSTKAIILTIILILGTSAITKVLGYKIYIFKVLSDWCLYNVLEIKEVVVTQNVVTKFIWQDTDGIIKCYIIGVVWICISTVVGFINFNKKEI